jgi:hypothetical protein
MTTFPNSPRLLKGAIVALNPLLGFVPNVIILQYNPDTLTRTLAVQGTGAQGGDRLEALRLKGPPAESIKLEAELDAADQLEHPDDSPTVAQLGLHPQLAVLESLVYPPSSRLQTNATLAALGTLEVAPVEAPLTVFVWSRNRIVPVRVTEFTITEEAFDPNLNPIRAKVSLGLHVLNVNDLPFAHRGANLFMAYQRQKEQLAAAAAQAPLSTLGISGIP